MHLKKGYIIMLFNSGCVLVVDWLNRFALFCVYNVIVILMFVKLFTVFLQSYNVKEHAG